MAQGNRIRDTTSLEAETIAIKECLKYYKRSSINQLILEMWFLDYGSDSKWIIGDILEFDYVG